MDINTAKNPLTETTSRTSDQDSHALLITRVRFKYNHVMRDMKKSRLIPSASSRTIGIDG